ncbi:MAG: cytochrome c [Sediminibacterium sp.]|nr:cytochrome c [Sediminibacterium sp.]
MKKILSFLLIAGFVITFNSCYYDKAELLYPTGALTNCDTTGTISYAAKVLPLFQQQCYSCHGVTGGSGGINMSSYANDKAIALNGKLFGSINHSAGYKIMPQGASKMTPCQIATIKKWIDSGSPNN